MACAVPRVLVLACGSQVGSSINMEGGFEYAAAHSQGEAAPVLPCFFPDRKVSAMRDAAVALDKSAGHLIP